MIGRVVLTSYEYIIALATLGSLFGTALAWPIDCMLKKVYASRSCSQ